jgi:hypothetical protein
MEATTGPTPRRLIAVCLAAVAGWFVLDAALFRANVYPSVLEPDSTTGLFELILRKERLAQPRLGDNLICTLGDSRFAFAPRLTDPLTNETGYVIRTAGVAGSDPRSWYYMLRDLDPHGNRYQAIVLGLNTYDDEDNVNDHADDIRTVHYVANRLRWYDTFDFPWTFRSPEYRWETFRACLFKGFVFQRDIHAFLDDPKKRIDYVRLCHRGYESWVYDYVETDRNMVGLSVDWNAGKATLPPNATADQKDTVEFAMKYPPNTEHHLDEYRRLWLGRILDHYKGSRTRVVFLRLPRGPIPRPGHPPLPSTIREFAKRPNVLLYDEHAFEFLEHPELFKDMVHLNREGIRQFSETMARGLGNLLGPPRPAVNDSAPKAPLAAAQP